MAGFRNIPEGPIRLMNVTVPGCLIGASDALVLSDISIANGEIVETGGTEIDMARAMVFPCFTDMHTHLDKGHIWPRASNPDGTFMGAITTVGEDRSANWTASDVAARMEFALRSAYAHGTSNIRTHIDSLPPQDRISWPVLAEMREKWAGRIELQGSSLVGCDSFDSIAQDYAATADIVAEHGGVLGMVTYPVPDVETRIREFFDLAGARGLEADFHVDETMDPDAETLRTIAEVVLDTGWNRPVTVGHCCSLSAQDEARALSTLDLVAKAGLNVVSLPLCNLYLQDRHAGRTPRMRGVTLVHEMKARGINVSFASDNTRDPFYAYGDLDMIEVMRQSTRIAHLDHSDSDWTHAFTTNPARACDFNAPTLAPGAPADLVICSARDWTELFARPQSDRIVIRQGRAIDTTLPAYSELDALMEV
ncbi:cytosine deaminase [Alphaproteobacteria bacterium GH1-50]|uniref:Cytosine deaminase n=1 Tax=Kangsaoukella pontilimi TaxID=2691042 RepID=A0A7C9MSB6_9RHOB|nr:cytosine deaminase [Kangsaoukella pontilimi]MXQ09097.1 cytosine deaminase [Kangsaoukella pontilimi]